METYTKWCGIIARVTNIFVLLSVSCVFFTACLPEGKITGKETVNKSLLLHEIKNETLKEYIARYDSAYNQGEKGIEV